MSCVWQKYIFDANSVRNCSVFQTDKQTLTNFPLFLGSTNNSDETSKTIFNHYTFTILKEIYLRKEKKPV